MKASSSSQIHHVCKQQYGWMDGEGLTAF